MRMNTNACQSDAVYELSWRVQRAANDAEAIGALIETQVCATEELRAMAAAGVIVEQVTGDHAILITRDEAVARRYGFRRRVDGAHATGDRRRARVTCAIP